MTVQEAIKYMELAFDNSDGEDLSDLYKDMCRIAIECMKEVEQYRALGTVEELKEAREKQIPKKCEIYTALQIGIDKDYEVDVYECPKCGTHLGVADEINQSPYCWNCGQALKWGEEDD